MTKATCSEMTRGDPNRVTRRRFGAGLFSTLCWERSGHRDRAVLRDGALKSLSTA